MFGPSFLLEDVLGSLSFQKCDKAVREKYQNSYSLGKIVSINMEIIYGNAVRFSIAYRDSRDFFAANIKAVVSYEPKSGKVEI